MSAEEGGKGKASDEARKKAVENVAAEDGKGKVSAEARKKAAENVAAEDGKGKGSAASAASASVEAVVDAVASANGKRGREMQLAGRVADRALTRDDRKMIADAVQPREAWENAMDIMRERRCGWVHSRIVSGRMVILLAQKFRVEAGVVEVLIHRDKAEVGEAGKRTRLRLKVCVRSGA